MGDDGGTGALNVGDGVGAAGSAAFEANNDLWIGRSGGTGTMFVKADGAVTIQTTTNNAELHIGDGSTGTVVQTGGTVTSDALVRIGAGAAGVGSYTISGGTLSTATDGTGAFQLGRGGGTGTLRVEGTGAFTHGAEFFVVNETDVNSVGRFEIAGSNATVQIGQLENPNAANDETVRWEADAGGVTSLVVTGAGPQTVNRVQLQDPAEATANTSSGASLMGDGIALELDLSAIISSMTLTLIDNQTVDAITGFFENPAAALDLYEEGASIAGTGFGGSVNISYLGGTGNDVVLSLVAGAVEDDADFDGDGDVDGADFLTWQRGVGTTSGATLEEGDATGEGAIDGDDLVVWEGQFGVPPAVVASAPVPEPSGILLAVAAGMAVCTIRRRRS